MRKMKKLKKKMKKLHERIRGYDENREDLF